MEYIKRAYINGILLDGTELMEPVRKILSNGLTRIWSDGRAGCCILN